MTRVTLENENGKYSIEVEFNELTLGELVTDLIIPALLAAGYSPSLVSGLILEYEKGDPDGLP